MKRLLFILVTALCVGSQLKALPYDQARQEAWFLTDKMAYELNLTSDQYDRAYQVNLDYFLSINSANDCYGYYWTYRDNDLRYILFDWQYTLYTTLDYFFRPVRWLRSAWYFPIFDHYRRGYYYFDRPGAYLSYRGVGWRRRGHNDISPYAGFAPRPGGGLRDRYHAGGAPQSRPEVGRGGNRSGFGNDRPGYGNNNRPGFNNGGQQGNRPGSGDNNRPGYNNGGQQGNRPGYGDNNNNRPGYNNGGHQGNRPSNGESSSNRGDNNNRGGSTTRPDRGNQSGNNGGTFGESNNRGGGTYSRPGRGNSDTGSGPNSSNNRSSSPYRGSNNGRGNAGGRSTSTTRPSRTDVGSSRSTTTRSQSAPSRSSSSSSRPSRSGSGGRSFGR